jgi:hypothetical protein
MAITKATASSVAPAAKGDLVVGSATNDAAVLSVGSNDQVLTADSSTTTGLKWATASSGGMTLISETVASSLTSLSFSSLGSYKQIYLVWDGIQHSTGSTAFAIRLNNNSTAIYPFMQWGEDNNGGTTQSLDTSYTYIGDAPNERCAFGHGATSSTNSDLVRGWFRVDNYTSSSKYKFWETRYSYKQVASATTKSFYDQGSFLSTSAITSIDIVRITGSASFSNTTNTTIRLYGVS